MVAGLSSNGDEEAGNALSSKEFRELRKKLEVFIKDNISGEDAREGIIKKLGELNRRPILDRLLFLLRKYDVPVGKIWTSNTDVETELGKIIRRRNLYIHQGRIDDFKQYYDDYSKLRILVELWILRLLDCPDDSINTSAIQVFLAR